MSLTASAKIPVGLGPRRPLEHRGEHARRSAPPSTAATQGPLTRRPAGLAGAAVGKPAADEPLQPGLRPMTGPNPRAENRHVRGHLQVVHPRPGRDTVAERPPDQAPVGRPPAGTRLLHDAGHPLTRIDLRAGRFAPLHVLRYGPETGAELAPAVECGHDHMPPLMPLRVIPVMTDDVPAQAVVVGVNPGHTSSLASEWTHKPARQQREPA